MTETTHTTPPAGPGGTAPLRPPLRRSRDDRKVAGVCGGLARHLGIDPIILRVLVVVLTIFGGSGLLLYAAGWLLIPDEGETQSEVQRVVDRTGGAGPTIAAVIVAGAVLVALAVLIGMGSAFGGGWWWGGGPDIWPIVVVAAVVGAVWYVRRQPPETSPPVTYTWDQGTPPDAGTQPTVPVTSTVPITPVAPVTATGPTATPPPPPAGAGWTPSVPPTPPPPPRPRREPSVLGALTVSTVLVAAGVMVLLDRTGVWDLHAVPFLAVLTGIVGLGLVVGAFVGRALWLTALGIVLTLATAAASVVPHVNGRTGDVTFAPTSYAEVPSDGYRWGAGNVTIDLTGTGLSTPGSAPRTVRASLGAGNLVVDAPSDVRLVVRAHVGLGSIRLPDGVTSDGIGRTVETVLPAVPTGSGGGTTSVPTLTLRLDLGVGNLEVHRAKA